MRIHREMPDERATRCRIAEVEMNLYIREKYPEGSRVSKGAITNAVLPLHSSKGISLAGTI